MDPIIRGIVVAGNTLEEAQALYRAVATGQDAQALHDEGENFVVLASASSDINLLNPLTGADDLKVGDGMTDRMEFLSSDSQAVNVNYTICTAGCNAHILADDSELMQHCPACASVLEDLTEEQIAALSGEEDECEGCQVQESVLASGATLEEAVANYNALVRGEVADYSTMQCGDTLVATAGAASFDVYKGCEAKIVENQEAGLLESLSSSADEIEAHNFVCASAACGVHVVSSDDMPVFCPACASGLLDPEDALGEEANASDDDVGEVEDDHHTSLSADEEDEEEEDEDDDLEEEEDDDDSDDDDDEDDDDSDEDDSDDEDDDEEDEDEDDDDALTLSVSSVQPSQSKRARKVQRQAATASVQEEEENEHVSVSASFLACASAQGDLDTSKLDVAHAAALQGVSTWIAFYDGMPIARATEATANNAHFNSEVFGRTFKAIAAEQGIPAAMEQMGFKEIKSEIQVGDFVQSEIQSQVAQKTQEVVAAAEQDKAELADRFAAALAMAAQGITNGFFKGKSNPVQQTLIEALSSVGLDNASALVKQAFLQSGEDYNKLLISQASYIMGKSLDVQNELGEAIAGCNTNANEEATAATAPVPLGRPVQVEKKEAVRQEATASAAAPADFQARATHAMRGLGRLR